jgi:hypothetical protein
VARSIAAEIQAKLTPREQERIGRARLVNPEAYEAYLKGRYYWNKRTPEGVKKGAEFFQQAIEVDATYAAAYAGLADSAGIAGWWGFVPPEQGCARAKGAARKSLEIEETAEAHACLGWAIIHYDFDTLSAEKEFPVPGAIVRPLRPLPFAGHRALRRFKLQFSSAVGARSSIRRRG